MDVIYKYHIAVASILKSYDEPIEVTVNRGAEILSVEEQAGHIVCWARVEQGEKHEEKRHFRIFPTGAPFDDEGTNLQFLKTLKLLNGQFILHVFLEERPVF